MGPESTVKNILPVFWPTATDLDHYESRLNQAPHNEYLNCIPSSIFRRLMAAEFLEIRDKAGRSWPPL
jgi:hypothetical protein